MRTRLFSALLYGWIFIFGLMFISSLILSFLLNFSNYVETNYSWITLTISFIALFLGGLIAGIKHKEKGWLIGILTGLTFSILIFFIQFLGFDRPFSGEQFLVHSAFIMLALLGGIIGVNIFVSNPR